MTTVVLQKYLTPYRVPLFNALSDMHDGDLTVLLYGKAERRRHWTQFPESRFAVAQVGSIGRDLSYEYRLDLPYGLPAALRRLSPNVIVLGLDLAAVLASTYARACRCVFVVWSEATVETERGRGATKTLIRRSILSRARAAIVPGQLSGQYLRNLGAMCRMFISRNAVDDKRFALSCQQIAAKHRRPTMPIVYSGSLTEAKGVDLLLRAHAKVVGANPVTADVVPLRLLGAGPLAAGLGQGGVAALGFLEGTSYSDAIRAASVFVLPSLHDCNPLTVIEALWSGSIIVVSDSVGSRIEAVQGNGRVVRTGSVDELAEAISWICSLSADERVQMGLRSRELAAGFSLASAAAVFHDALLFAERADWVPDLLPANE